MPGTDAAVRKHKEWEKARPPCEDEICVAARSSLEVGGKSESNSLLRCTLSVGGQQTSDIGGFIGYETTR